MSDTTPTTTHADHDVWRLISKPGVGWCRPCQVEFDLTDTTPTVGEIDDPATLDDEVETFDPEIVADDLWGTLTERGYTVTDPTSRARQAFDKMVETIAGSVDNLPTPYNDAVELAARTCAVIVDYEHGEADWPCDPDAYVAAAIDLAMCLILGGGR